MSNQRQKTDQKETVNQVFQGKFMREDASFLETLFYSYARPLLDSSVTQQIKFEQYGELPDRLRICHEAKIIESNIQHYIKKNPQDRYAFMKGILKTNQWHFLKFCTIRTFLTCRDVYQPLLMAGFISWLQDSTPDTTYTTCKAVGTMLLLPVMSMIMHTTWEYFCFQMIEVGHRAHTSLKTILFQKDLRMTGATNKDFSEGEISSIIMGDSNKIWDFIWQLPEFLECPFVLIASCYFTFQAIGYYGFIVVFLTLAQFALSYYRENAEKDVHKEIQEKTDKRMLHINESFQNIKGVKLYGWENKFINKIEDIYKEEVAIKNSAEIRNQFYDFLGGCLHQIMPILVYGLYVWNGNALDLGQMILANSMMSQIRGRMHQANRIYRNVFILEEAMARLNIFYNSPEVQKGLVDKVSTPASDNEYALTVQGSFSWGISAQDKEEKDKLQEKAKKKEEKRLDETQGTLKKWMRKIVPARKQKYDIPIPARSLDHILNIKNIDLKVKKGEFVVIIGEVGSGKTSLLSSMIGEMIHFPQKEIDFIGDQMRKMTSNELKALDHVLQQQDFTGNSPVTVHGSTGFVESQHWIQNGKLRDNVCFGSELDERKYVETILACQLETDIMLMPAGDMTEIGEKGINLSGGQKARVSLARAVYKRPDVIFMDDPISALDCTTRKKIFEEVFQGILADKTRILVTHAIDFVHLADKIVIMNDGQITAQGTYDELINNPYMQQIQNIHMSNKDELANANEEDKPPQFNRRQSGEPARVSISDADTNSSDEHGSVKSALDDQEISQKLETLSGATLGLDEKTQKVVGKLLMDEKDEKVNADSATAYKLWGLMGGSFTIILFILQNLFFRAIEVYTTYVTNSWSETTPEEQTEKFSEYMKTLTFIGIFGLTCGNLRDIFLSKMKKSVGRNVHKQTLRQVLFAPVNIFFDVTPVGKILNIFTRNMNVFYGQIVEPLNHMMNMTAHVLVVFYYLFTLGSWWVVIPSILLMVVLGQKIATPYLHADNQLHKVGSTLWTPIHSYFHESMRGKSIIRAFQQEQTITDRQNHLLDQTTTHFIAHHSCWVWFNLRMFYTSKILAIVTIVMCAMNKGSVDNVSLVIALQYSCYMGWMMHFFGCLNWFSRMLIDVQKVFNLQEAPQEKFTGTAKAPEQWPSQGKIEFKDVELRYRPNTEVVLRKLDFTVSPGEKVGIVGRTGAGKSTISMALTRIVELMGGKIEIDGVDIANLDIADLREQITMIPQDPVMFSGTLRYNLDPFDESSDERMIELIKKAGLEYLLEGVSKQELKEKHEKELKAKKAGKDEDAESSSSETKEADEKKDEADEKKDEKDEEDEDDGKGLKFKVKEEGKNLSVGERQLICIIRAILRNNKIVILDEATANIDVVTEQAIQKLIDEEFKGATVMCIAHRLNTIIRSDKVLVMDKGRAIEFDSPQKLMSRKTSVFSQMLKEKKRSADEF